MTTARRQWVVVVVVLVAALAAGFLLSMGAEDVHTATGAIIVDTGGQARNVPKPDTLIRYATSGSVRDAVAAETGVSTDQVSDGLAAAGLGNPIATIQVRFSAGSESDAISGAQVAIDATIDRFLELAADEIEYRRQRVELTQAGIDAIENSEDISDSATPYEMLNLEISLEGKRLTLLDVQKQYTVTLNAFVADEDISTSVKTAAETRGMNLIGAGIAGLILGLLLATVKETVSRSASSE